MSRLGYKYRIKHIELGRYLLIFLEEQELKVHNIGTITTLWSIITQ